MRAIVYARISNDRTGAGLGVDRQREDCEKLAADLGLDIVDTYTDNDVSAYSGKPRPGYLAMLEALREGRANVVLAWHADRLHRSPAELEEFIDICSRHSVTVRTVQAGEVDLSTPAGQMTARIIGAVARHEIDHARARMLKARAQAAELGRAHGRVPYGYRNEFDRFGNVTGRSPDPNEAPHVREAVERVLAGESMYSVRMDWAKRGILTRAGKPWTAASFREMVMRPTYAGIRTHKGVKTPGAWEPIITTEQHERIVALLDDPSRVAHRGIEPKYLLSGIAKCGVCGELMWRLKGNTKPGQDSKGSYACTKNRCTSRNIERVDALIEETIIRWCEGISSIDDLSDPESAAALAEARELRSRLDESTDLVAEGELSPRALAKLEAKLLPRIRQLERQAERAPSPHVLELVGENARRHWQRMDVSTRRDVVRALMTVTIMPTKRRRTFEPADIRVDWL